MARKAAKVRVTIHRCIAMLLVTVTSANHGLGQERGWGLFIALISTLILSGASWQPECHPKLISLS